MNEELLAEIDKINSEAVSDYQKGDFYSNEEKLLQVYSQHSELEYVRKIIAMNLGFLYNNPKFEKYDKEKARKFFEISAEAGYTAALHKMGKLYLNEYAEDKTQKQKKIKGISLLKNAAEKGEFRALNDIGVFYYNHEKEYFLAAMYCKVAYEKSGDAESKKNYEYVSSMHLKKSAREKISYMFGIKDIEAYIREIGDKHTADEMYQYCMDNNYIGDYSSLGLSFAAADFGVIARKLYKDEEVYICALDVDRGRGHSGRSAAYAITNKRVIMGRMQGFREHLMAIELDNINDVSMSENRISGMITINSPTMKFYISLPIRQVRDVHERLQEILKNNRMKNRVVVHTEQKQTQNVADEIMKFKNLLDIGAITQEEYEAKKKQLLGL